MQKVKIIIVLFLVLFVANLVHAYDFKANCEERIFVVTAYYSPKSWQAFYYKDTYEAEKTLNWEWLNGASGKPVFNGMLAAPSSYDFGGLLYFPSLEWIGEIADRWWAIVHAWEKSFIPGDAPAYILPIYRRYHTTGGLSLKQKIMNTVLLLICFKTENRLQKLQSTVGLQKKLYWDLQID